MISYMKYMISYHIISYIYDIIYHIYDIISYHIYYIISYHIIYHIISYQYTFSGFMMSSYVFCVFKSTFVNKKTDAQKHRTCRDNVAEMEGVLLTWRVMGHFGVSPATVAKIAGICFAVHPQQKYLVGGAITILKNDGVRQWVSDDIPFL